MADARESSVTYIRGESYDLDNPSTRDVLTPIDREIKGTAESAWSGNWQVLIYLSPDGMDAVKIVNKSSGAECKLSGAVEITSDQGGDIFTPRCISVRGTSQLSLESPQGGWVMVSRLPFADEEPASEPAHPPLDLAA